MTITQGVLMVQSVNYVRDDGVYQCVARNRHGAVLSKELNIRIRGEYPL